MLDGTEKIDKGSIHTTLSDKEAAFDARTSGINRYGT